MKFTENCTYFKSYEEAKEFCFKVVLENISSLNLGSMVERDLLQIRENKSHSEMEKRYKVSWENLSEEEKERIFDMEADRQMLEYQAEGDRMAAEVERGYLNGECSIGGYEYVDSESDCDVLEPCYTEDALAVLEKNLYEAKKCCHGIPELFQDEETGNWYVRDYREELGGSFVLKAPYDKPVITREELDSFANFDMECIANGIGAYICGNIPKRM